VRPFIERFFGRVLDERGRIKVRFARAEADDIDPRLLHGRRLGADGQVIDSETSFILSASGTIYFGPPMGFGTVSAYGADFK
jgi:hypothetical protein